MNGSSAFDQPAASQSDKWSAFNSSPVERITSICSNRFVKEYVNTGTPVVITNMTRSWPARQKWGTDYFMQEVGDVVVPLYSSAPASGKSKQDDATMHLPIRDYLQKLKDGEKDLRMFFYNILAGAPKLIQDFSYPDCGLTFFKRLPVLFVGGKDAKVQMHHDIDLANILLCHFGGRKRVLLFSKDQSRFMYRVPWSFSSLHKIDFSNPNTTKYPALGFLKGQTAELNHGDVLFIPSGCWHYIIYDEIGYSLSLRAYPAGLMHKLHLLKNVFITRTIENLMRRLAGQSWIERNERLAIEKTHAVLGNKTDQT